MGYTLAQVRAYLGAIERAERRRLRGQLLVLRAAQADEARYRRLLGALES